MSDQKKPQVPSFEDLQKAAQPDPRLAKTAPHAPNPLLIDQTRPPGPLGPTTPGSRLDPEMLQRLAQSGLAGDPRYGPAAHQEARTQLGPAPNAPTGDERTVTTRPPSAPLPAAPRPPQPPASQAPASTRPAAGPPSAYMANAPLRPASLPPAAPARAPTIPPVGGALPNATRAPAASVNPFGPPGPPAPPSNAPRAPSSVPSVAGMPGVPRAPNPPGPPAPPSNVPLARAPSIPAAPASLAPTRPPPVGPPPRVPAPPTGQPVARAPTMAPAAPQPPLRAAQSPTPAPMKPVAAAPVPPATVALRPSNAPPPPQYSPSIAKTATTTPAVAAPDDGTAPTTIKPMPQPPASRVAISPEDPTGLSATVLKPVPEPPTSRVQAPRFEPPAPAQRTPTARPAIAQSTGNPTLQMSRAELANQFDDSDSPTTPRIPAMAPGKSPQPKVPASNAVEERTPHVPLPVVTAEPRPLSFAAADSNTPLPHLERPPSLNSKSLLDVSPVLAQIPVGRSQTVNLRASAGAPTPPEEAPTPPRPAPQHPPAMLDLAPEERTPVKMGKAFAVTQPGVPGPFGGKRPLATPGPIPPVQSELAPTTDAGFLEPVTSNDHGSALRSSLGEAFDPELRSEVQPVRVTAPKAQLVAAPASLIRRCLSFTVDFVLVGTMCLGLLYLASLMKGVKALPPHLAPLDALLFRMHGLDKLLLPSLAACALAALFYATFFAMALQGRTPGRLLSGVRLVTQDGETPGPVRAVVRGMLGFVSFGLFLSGFWLALFDRKGQTLHDKLTRTFVVRPL